MAQPWNKPCSAWGNSFFKKLDWLKSISLLVNLKQNIIIESRMLIYMFTILSNTQFLCHTIFARYNKFQSPVDSEEKHLDGTKISVSVVVSIVINRMVSVDMTEGVGNN